MSRCQNSVRNPVAWIRRKKFGCSKARLYAIAPLLWLLLLGFIGTDIAEAQKTDDAVSESKKTEATSGEAKAGSLTDRQTKVSATVKGKNGKEVTLNYWLYLPTGYDTEATGKKWPVMLFLHGRGECGDDLNDVKKWGPPRLLGDKKNLPFIVVSPQCPTPGWDVVALKKLMDGIVTNHQVDTTRFYVTGLSMGGFGAWKFASTYPQFVAAVVPICGGGDARMAESLVKLPIWAFHGDRDRIVPLSGSKNIIDAIKELGGEKAKLTVYEGVGHNSWTETYSNEKVYEWMLEHQLPSHSDK